MLAELRALATDFWWTTQGGVSESFWSELDPVIWEAVNHNPVQLLQESSLQFASDSWKRRAEELIIKRQTSLVSPPKIPTPRTAYFCMEYGLHESLPIYSGGLGMLAGDHLRSASDQGIDLVAVGMFWHEGYFRQLIFSGRQVSAYSKNDPSALAVEPVLEENGDPLVVTVPLGDEQIRLHAHLVRIGKVKLYLLDTDVEGNKDEQRSICDRLYGGDSGTRIQQEWILGIGGARFLEALGEDIEVYHMNEGHSAFLLFELWRKEMATGVDADSAWCNIKSRCVFTTHTPVPAGHDRFTWTQFDSVARGFRKALGLSDGSFMDKGRERPGDVHEPLCMTVLGMNGSRSINGVSKLHGEVSREMWKNLPVDIGHITNGVHAGAWVAPETSALFDTHLCGWTDELENPEFWLKAKSIPSQFWIETRNARKSRLVKTVRRILGTEVLDPNKLTLGFARRFAPYKRGGLIFRHPEKLEALLKKGVQIVFAGKAHPADDKGQDIIAEILKWSRQKRFQSSIAFIPDYDMTIGRLMTGCCDVWLNTPRRPREASGTSGQKAAINGNPNCSILDGWWPEAFDETNGWAIGDESALEDLDAQDERDAGLIYDLIEHKILPCYQDDEKWAKTMAASVQTCMPVFNTSRMLTDYASKLYGVSR
jgi:glycogen phosphorylase